MIDDFRTPDRPAEEPVSSSAFRSAPVDPVIMPSGSSLELPATPIVEEPTMQSFDNTGDPQNFSLKLNKEALLYTVGATAVIVLMTIATILLTSVGKTPVSSGSKQSSYAVGNLAVEKVKSNEQLGLANADHLDINGQLRVKDSVILTPGKAPQAPIPGQMYFDKTTKKPYYYNGSAFVSMSGEVIPEHVTTIGGAAGALALGSSLTIEGNTIAVSSDILQSVNAASNAVNTPRVSSLQGLTGNVTLTSGSGISITGTKISNTGVLGVVAGSGINITNNGNGTFTIDNQLTGVGGMVQLAPGSAQLDSSNNVSIQIDKTGTGNFIELSDSSVNKFVVDQTGTITVGTIAYSQVQGAPVTTVTTINGLSGPVGVGAGIGTSGSNLINTGVVSVTGTANQVIVSTATGDITLSLPQDIDTSSVPSFSGLSLSGDLDTTQNITARFDITTSRGLIGSGDATHQGSFALADGNGFVATLLAGPLTQDTTYTFPDTGGLSASICLDIGNCTPGGAAGGDLSGTFPNPTIAKLQGVGLSISSIASGDILQYDGSSFVNQALTGDVTLDNNGVTTIGAGKVTNLMLQNSNVAVSAGTGLTGGGTISLGGSTTLNVAYGASAGSAVQGNTAITCPAGTGNLSGGGGSITLGAGGSCGNITISNTPTFAGNVTSGTATSTEGSFTIAHSSGSNLSKITATAPTGAGTATYNLPSVAGGSSVNICLDTGNCAGTGGGIIGAGTAGTIAKFSAAGTIADSALLESGTTLTYGGNLVVNAANGFVGNVVNAKVNNSSVFTVDNSGNLVVYGSLKVNTLGSGMVTSDSSGNLSSGSVDRNNSTYFNTALSVANGGTGTNTLTSKGILYGNGAGAVQATSSAADSVLVTDGSSNPSLSSTLPVTVQGNITKTGALATGSIASGFGAISTTNGITTTATVQGGTLNGTSFIKLNGTDINTAGTLTNVAYLNQANVFTNTANFQGDVALGLSSSAAGRLLFSNATNSNKAILVASTPTGSGNGTYNLPAIAAGSSVDICLTTGNCAGSGGGLVGSGTAGVVAVFTGSGTLGDSGLTDSGTILNYTGDIVIDGGLYSGTPTVAGTLSLQDGAGLAGILQVATLGQGVTYTLPDPGVGTATICLTSGNCAGVGGGIVGTGTSGTIPIFTGSGTIGDSSLSVASGALTYKDGSSNSVLKVDATSHTTTLFANSDSTATLGPELVYDTDYSSPNWTTYDTPNWTLGLTATYSGSGDDLLSDQFAAVVGDYYRYSFNISGATSNDCLNVAVGDSSWSKDYCGNGTYVGYAQAWDTIGVDFSVWSWSGPTVGLTISNVSVKHADFPASADPVLVVKNSNSTPNLEVRTTNDQSIAIGYSAGETSLLESVAIGDHSLQNNMGGSENVAVGGFTLQNNIDGYRNTAIGSRALKSNQYGSQNVALGSSALQSNVNGDSNTAIGAGALRYSTSSYNTSVGAYALSTDTTGYQNTALGAYSLVNNTTGNYSVGLGYSALGANSTGDYNIGLGYGAAGGVTTGSNNIGIGAQTLGIATSSSRNIAIGMSALNGITAADSNVAIGFQAAGQTTTGTKNVGVGESVLGSNTSGSNNAALGYLAGYTNSFGNANTTGSNNTFIGFKSGPGVSSAKSLQNATALGTNSIVSSNDTVALGCYASTNACSSTGSVVSIASKGYGTLGDASTLNALNISSANYSTGTISTSGSSTTVTGSGTSWSDGMAGGTIYFLDSGGTYRSEYIASLDSGGQTLVIGTARTITAGTSYVIVYGGNRVSSTGAQTIQNTSDTTQAFQVLQANGQSVINVDTTNSQVTINGWNDTSFYFFELLGGNCSGTNWSGTGGGPYTHAAGSTADLVCPVSGGVTPGASYRVSYTLTPSDSTTRFTPYVGAQWGSDDYGSINEVQVITATNTDSLAFNIGNASETGTISNISIKKITLAKAALQVKDVLGVVSLDVHASPSTEGNTFIGLGSGQSNLIGTSNTALGYGALKSNTEGNYNTAVGTGALQSNSEGDNNLAFGANALGANTTGNTNIAIGNQALWDNSTGSENTALGYFALQSNTVGTKNLAIGGYAMQGNIDGLDSIGIGYHSMWNATSSFSSVALGNYALENAGSTVATVAIGSYALQNSGTAINTAVGYTSLQSNTSGTHNVALGYQSLYANNTGSYNLALGDGAGVTSDSLKANIDGSYNSYLGYNAGKAVYFTTNNSTSVGAMSVANSSDTVALGCVSGVNGCTGTGSGSVVSIASKGYGTLSGNNVLNALNVAGTTYSTGTVSTSGTSTTVTGSGTAFTSAMIGGTIYFIDSGVVSRTEYISNVSNGTSLTIGTARSINAGTPYVIAYGGNRTSSTGAMTLQNTSDSTSAFQIQNAAAVSVVNVDTANSQLTVRGSQSDASVGAELLSGNCSGSNWSGTGSGPYTHSAGSTASLTCSVSGGVIAGATYQVTYDTSIQSTTGITPRIGSVSGLKTLGSVSNQVQIITTSDGSSPSFLIDTSGETGSIYNISIKLVTSAKSALSVINQNGSTTVSALEVRTSTMTGNTLIGYQAGQTNTTGTGGTALGYQALQNNTTGNQNTAIGYQALQSNTAAVGSVAIGYQALKNNTTGSQNTAIGSLALSSNVTGYGNVAIGLSALGANVTGYANFAAGRNSLLANTTGYYNIAIGEGAMQNNITGYDNVAVGPSALSSNNSIENTAVGKRALTGNTGGDNVAFGWSALQGTGSGSTNAAFGSAALFANTNGSGNVGVGSQALYSNTTASDSTSVGANSLYVSTGDNNTALGYQAGYTSNSSNANTTGAGNTFIGSNSGAGVASASSLQNSTAIGFNSTVNSSNTVALGCVASINSCSSSGSVVSVGSRGYGTLSANATLNALNVASSTYSTGTISTSGSSTTVSGSSTVWTAAMVGGTIYFMDNGSVYRQEYVSAINTGAQTLTIGTARTITAGTSYVIVYGGNRTSGTGAQILQNTADSTAAFKIQSATTADTLFTADTTNNRLIVGNATASAGTDTTLFVVDSYTGANQPTGVNGGLAYDATNGRLKAYENSGWTTICTTTNLACSASGGDVYLANNQTFTGLNVFQPASSLTAGQSSLTNTLTNASSTGGTVTGFNEALTVSNTSSASTSKGIALTVTDGTSIANNVNTGIDLTVTDNGSATSKTNTGLKVTMSGTNSSQAQIGIDSSVTKGVGLRAVSSGASSSTIACGPVFSITNVPVGLCASDGSGGGSAVYATTNNAEATDLATMLSSSTIKGIGVGALSNNNNNSTGVTTALRGYASGGSSLAQTAIGVLGIGTETGASALAYGGYFTIDSANTATTGAALYASTPTYSSGASTGRNAVNVLQAAGGAGQATSSTGGVSAGAGSAISLVTGLGGNATGTSGANTGGAGGAVVLTASAGGTSASTNSSALGGAGGAVSISTGAGGANSAASGTAKGGAGGALTISTGNGGASTTAGLGGNAGAITIQGGNGGNGTGANANGNGGSITLSAGKAGTGGTGGTAGSVIIKPVSGGDSTTAFQVQNAAGTSTLLNADTTSGIITVTAGSDSPIAGAELANNNFNTSWTGGADWTLGASSATHAATGSNTLHTTASISITAGSLYKLVYTVSGYSAGTLSPSVGGVNGNTRNVNGTFTDYITATSTSNLIFSPSATFVGTISSVSLTLLSATNSALVVKNTSGVASLEFRASSATDNTFIGVNSGSLNVTGTDNTSLGYQALQKNVRGISNTAVGSNALQLNTGDENNAFGYNSLAFNTNGIENIAVGNGALLRNVSGSNGTAVGYGAGSGSQANENTFIGSWAGFGNAIGSAYTGSDFNVFVGATSGYSIGNNADNNSALGHSSLRGLTTGTNNTVLGYQAGYTSVSANATTTGSGNTYLGYNAGAGMSTYQLQNSSAVGSGATVNSSNTIAIGCVASVNGCSSAGTSVSIGDSGYGRVNSSGTTMAPFTVGGTTYSTGTVSQSTNTITGAGGATFTPAMTGGTIFYANGDTDYITYATSSTLTAAQSRTESSQNYVIAYAGFNIFGNSYLKIQNTSDSATAVQIQNAAGTTLFNADTSSMVIKVAGNTTTFATLQIDNAHFKSTQTTAPTIGTPASCGTGPTASVTAGSTDTAGSITINTGSGVPVNCATTITFNKTYGAAPKSVIITPAYGGAVMPFVSAVGATTFNANLNSPAASTSYVIYYMVIE